MLYFLMTYLPILLKFLLIHTHTFTGGDISTVTVSKPMPFCGEAPQWNSMPWLLPQGEELPLQCVVASTPCLPVLCGDPVPGGTNSVWPLNRPHHTVSITVANCIPCCVCYLPTTYMRRAGRAV